MNTFKITLMFGHVQQMDEDTYCQENGHAKVN